VRRDDRTDPQGSTDGSQKVEAKKGRLRRYKLTERNLSLMTDVLKMGRKALTVGVVLTTIAWSMMAAVLVAPLKASAAGCTAGTLVKGSLAAVYYCGSDGKRYVFTNDKSYFTWYTDFSGVTTISDADLASLQIGGNVTYRPGVKMLKIQSDPKVYAVSKGGVLRPIASEAVAACLYGATWNQQIHDVSDAFFTNYTVGAAVNACSDYDKNAEMSSSQTVNQDKNLGAISGAVSVSLAADNPASATIISDGTNNVAGSQAMIDMLKLKLSGNGTVKTLKFTRTGVSTDSDLDNAYLYWDGKLVEMTSFSLGVLTFDNLNLAIAGEKTVALKVDLNKDVSAGKTMGFKVNSASDVVLSDSTNGGGTYPLMGNAMTTAVVGDFGRLQLTGLTNSTTVDPGTNDVEVMKFQLAL
jgi:hypothetical protein